MFTALFFLLTAGITILWSFPFLLLTPFGYGMQKLSGRKLISFLTKHVAYSSIRANDEPSGWIVGKWFIGYIYELASQNSSPTKELCILINTRRFKAITEGDVSNSMMPSGKMLNGMILKGTLNYMERDGSTYYNLWYDTRQIAPTTLIPWKHQAFIVQQIVDTWMSKGYATVLLTGDPGSGKSMIALHLCTVLLTLCTKVYLTDTFDPFNPGDFFSGINNKAGPTPYTPDGETTALVVVIEEVDGMVYAMHNGKIQNNKSAPIPIQIKNKTDWNLFFDRFDRGLYPGVILILTSNRPLKWFDDMDPSYMRDGRLSAKFEVVREKVKQT